MRLITQQKLGIRKLSNIYRVLLLYTNRATLVHYKRCGSQTLTMDAIHGSTFDQSLTYALSKIGKPGIILKEEQRSVVRHIYYGKDVFLWLPTGFGKSICYEVLPFLFDHKLATTASAAGISSVVLVISPLLSLMVDQVASLRSRGVSAAIMTGHQGLL